MKSLVLKSSFGLVAAVIMMGTSQASAQKVNFKQIGNRGHQHRLVAPTFQHLPRFGFKSRTIRGYGERVAWVGCRSRAERIGLEPGDTIIKLNHYRLTYNGAWEEALSDAVDNHDGWVRLKIRDVRTGYIASRTINVLDNYRSRTSSYNYRRQ